MAQAADASAESTPPAASEVAATTQDGIAAEAEAVAVDDADRPAPAADASEQAAAKKAVLLAQTRTAKQEAGASQGGDEEGDTSLESETESLEETSKAPVPALEAPQAESEPPVVKPPAASCNRRGHKPGCQCHLKHKLKFDKKAAAKAQEEEEAASKAAVSADSKKQLAAAKKKQWNATLLQ